MTDGIFISDRKRLHLQVIFKQLGLNQKEIAEAIDLSAASISRFLNSGTDQINLRPENFRRLVNVLKERLAACRAVKSLSNEEVAARIKKGGKDKAAVEAALALSSETIKVLEGEILELLAGDPDSGSAAPRPILAMPGGALGVHAKNYVRRKADDEIEGILQAGRSPSSVVLGPINGGTSSFLKRVYQRAHEMRDCWACIVHLEAAFAKGEKFTQLDLFRFLFREMGITGDALADRFDVHEMKDAFDAWAETTWRGAARVVVVIDGLDEVFKNAGSLADPLALTNWLQALRNRAAGGEPPYDKLALFVALTGTTWSAAHGSPYATQAGSLELNKFTPQQVAEMFKQLEVNIDEHGIDHVYRLFHGHPYLTQLFAWSMRSESSQQSATEAALSLASRYEAHWERMKSEIQFLIGNNFTLRRVLASIAKVAAHPTPQPPDESDVDIWLRYRRGLRTFGLVDGPREAPTICQFYRTAMEREQP